MAYTPGFDYDVFISFSHEDNRRRSGAEGWIEHFREYLEWWLISRRGLKNLRIWWDKERLNGNTHFDQRTKRALGNSALLFVVHSRNYRDSDYCAIELDWFVEKAKRHPVGLSVNGEGRIFNVLINNIPPASWADSVHWTAPLAGTAGFPFHDAEQPEDLGDPIEPDQRQRFYEAMRPIVDDATRLLKRFQQLAPSSSGRSAAPAVPRAKVPTLYVADVQDGLAKLRRRLIHEIGERARILDPLPPPYDGAGHDKAVRAALGRADLSIHLLGESPGREIEDTEVSYPQRQVHLAANADTPTLLWMPETLQPEQILNEEYRDWLEWVENASRVGGGYQFLRGTREGLIDDVLEQIAHSAPNRRGEAAGPRTFVIDPHPNDQHYGFELATNLKRKYPDVTVRVTSDGEEPTERWNEFEGLVRQSQELILLFGQAPPEWVKGRVERAFKVAATQIDERVSLQTLWLLLLPGCPGVQAMPNLPKLVQAELLDNRGSSRIAEETMQRLIPGSHTGSGF